jgi:hypothetical protein
MKRCDVFWESLRESAGEFSKFAAANKHDTSDTTLY